MTLTVNDSTIDHYEVAAGSNSPRICLCEDTKSTGGDTRVTFSTNDIQNTCTKLKTNGVKVTEPYEAHGKWWASFKDLDGNSYGLSQE